MQTLQLATGQLDLATGCLARADGTHTQLTPQESALVRHLSDRQGEDVSREALLTQVLGYQDHVVSRAVDDAIKRLRTKIERVPSRPFHLVSVRGVGYRFVPLARAREVDVRLHLGRRVVDLDLLRVLEDGQTLATLSSQEGRLLEVLSAHRGKPVAFEDLLRQVWEIRDIRQRRVVDKAIYRLRSKIEPDPGSPRHLRTVRGVGLLLEASPAVPLPGGRPVSPPPAEMFGRTELSSQLSSSLEAGTLVTLHGPAGAGKSTLARRAAAGWSGVAREASLMRCQTADDVLDRLNDALGVEEARGRASESLRHALSQHDGLLLVLDDAEACVQGLVEILTDLQDALGRIAVIVTSRRVLGLAGERVIPVGPMAPAAARDLFRARARRAGVTLSEEDELLDQLVEGVDRLPLALELAAARVRLLGLPGLVSRLDRPLDVFRSRGDRGRHGSLRAALSWSWSALGRREREILAGITLFDGPFPVAAAEALLDDSLDALDSLQELVDLAQLRRLPGGLLAPYHGVSDVLREELADQLAALHTAQRPRVFRWLATCAGPIRVAEVPTPKAHGDLRPALDIALTLLSHAPPEPTTHATILHWVLPMLWRIGRNRKADALLAEFPHDAQLPGPLARSIRYLRCRPLDPDRSQLPAWLALADEAAEAHDDELEGLALGRWLATAAEAGHPDQPVIRDRLATLLPRLDRHPIALIRARFGLGWDAFRFGDLDRAWAHLQEALAGCRRHQLGWEHAEIARSLAGVCHAEGRLTEAEAFLQSARQNLEQGMECVTLRGIDDTLGLVRLDQGRITDALTIHERLYEFERHAGHPLKAAIQANRLGTLHGHQGRPDAAIRWFGLARAGFEAEGHVPRAAGALFNLGYCHHLGRHHAEARRQFQAALGHYRALQRRVHEGIVLAMLGRLDLEDGHHAQARAQLTDAVELLDRGRARKQAADARALLSLARVQCADAPTEALATAERALEDLRSMGSGPTLPAVQLTVARIHLHLGDPTTARRLREEAISLASSFGGVKNTDVGVRLEALDQELAACSVP